MRYLVATAVMTDSGLKARERFEFECSDRETLWTFARAVCREFLPDVGCSDVWTEDRQFLGRVKNINQAGLPNY